MLGDHLWPCGNASASSKLALSTAKVFRRHRRQLLLASPVENMLHPLTDEHIIAARAVDGLTDVIARHGLGRNLMLVCDDKTWVAIGQQISVKFAPHFNFKAYSLGRNVHATLAAAEELAAAADGYDGFLAVGSGTVNDVTKYAATIIDKPYISIATAASMNGYSSASASLLVNGFKQSYPARPPKAVIADLTVIAAAPKRLVRAGLGDTLCRSSVEVDVRMAHLLIGSPYPADIFELLRKHEPELISNAPKLRLNDINYYKTLMQVLLETGDLMAKTGSSAISSQGEHMIGHAVESIYGSELHSVLHGELIAVTTLTMGQLQQRLMLKPFIVKSIPRSEADFVRAFGKHAGPMLSVAYGGKVLSEEQVVEINAKVASDWNSIKQALTEIMVQPSVIERAFIQSGVPTQPSEIRVNEHRYQSAVSYAYMARDRFTFLDLNAMMESASHVRGKV